MKKENQIEEVEKGCGRIIKTGFSSYTCGKKDGRFHKGYKLCPDCEKGIKPKTMLERIQEELDKKEIEELKKPHFYMMDLQNYNEDFLIEIIEWFNQELEKAQEQRQKDFDKLREGLISNSTKSGNIQLNKALVLVDLLFGDLK